jgi:hypothetical protein
MELFSEIYGAYFRTAERILSKGRLTPKEVQQLIQEEAFRDSMLFLPQNFIGRPASIPVSLSFKDRRYFTDCKAGLQI